MGQTPIPCVNRITDRCKNITLPQTSFAGGKDLLVSAILPSSRFRWPKGKSSFSPAIQQSLGIKKIRAILNNGVMSKTKMIWDVSIPKNLLVLIQFRK